MRLYLAEKKSLGEAIAAGLGGGKAGGGRIECGADVVSWCAGHLFEELMPEDYDPAWKTWSMDVLPIVPTEWKVRPKKTAIRQLEVIGNLLARADSVVNCGDPDREGQLLVDEVLEHFGYRGPVLRLWLDDGLTPNAVRRALDRMTDNAEKAPLRDAARARTRADWLVGLNATRAMTIRARSAGHEGVLSVGRVRTPTLNLVVQRDLLIENFTPSPYFVLKAAFKLPAGTFWATYRPEDGAEGLDSDGRLADEARADAILQGVRGASGRIVLATREEKRRQPPLAHSLASLSKAASARHGMTAKQVLDAAQALYLARLTSYPRTNCRHLPEDQHAEAPDILAALARLPDTYGAVAKTAAQADPALKSPAWNSARQTAHHGIIPTGELPDGDLPPQQRQIFELVCLNYALQFHGAMLYEAQAVQVEAGGSPWRASGRRIIDPGWTALAADAEGDEEQEEDGVLPAASEGDAVSCEDASAERKMTTPPARFTDGTLLEAMENVHRFVEADGQARDVLRRTKGIGTDATRATILDDLVRAELLRMEGRKIVSTELGRRLVALVPDDLKDPLTTADWEGRLEDVAGGRLSLEAFLEGILALLPGYVEEIRGLEIACVAGAHPCPECGQILRRFRYREKPGFYWACRNTEGHKNGEAVFCDDVDGSPVPRTNVPCPVCSKPMRRFQVRDTKDWKWGCFEKDAHPGGEAVVVDDRKGAPIIHPCPECSLPMRRNRSRKDGKAFYWACFNSAGHKDAKPVFANDRNGSPLFGAAAPSDGNGEGGKKAGASRKKEGAAGRKTGKSGGGRK